MNQAERLSAILAELSEDGGVEVASLALRFSVSAATVRRDLELLEGQRLLARTHGGAVPMGVVYELPLRYKGARHHDEKRRIAEAAADLIDDGMAVGLTGGTTCTEVAREIVERERLTVVTNALNIASELAVRPNLKLVVTGGTARPESYELVGPLAEQSLAGLHLDLVVIGVDGIDAAAGCTTHHEVEAHTNLALIQRADRVVVVADSSKIGRAAFARICDIALVHQLITDRGADKRALRGLREAGVAVEAV
jgi:DeoR family transcriptional regulator of aga operon